MSGTFFDTSALVKHYHTDAGSDEVDRLWNAPASALFISRLSVPEIASAFAGKVRTGEISAPDFDVLTRRFAADCQKEEFHDHSPSCQAFERSGATNPPA